MPRAAKTSQPTPPSARVRLADVARRAGVSVGTASMALAGGSQVLPATAEKVRQAAKALGYTPLRRRLPSGEGSAPAAHDEAIAMIAVGIDYGAFPIYARLLQIMGAAAAQRGRRLISRMVGTHEEAVEAIRQSQVVGVVLLWQDPHEGRIDVKALQQSVACVRVLGSLVPGSTVDHVTCDNQRIGDLAAQYLWDRGHRVAAALQYDQPLSEVFRHRARAFVEHFEKLGGKAKVFRFFGNVQAHEIAQAIAAEAPRPTGIFTGDDGTLSRFDLLFRHLGLVPGREIEMIGCNNEDHRLDELSPRPATIDLQLEILADQALEVMSWRLKNRHRPRMQVIVEPRLVSPPAPGSTRGGR